MATFMYAWAALSHIWLLIQTIQIYTSQDVSSLSLIAFGLLLSNSIIWFTYGAYVLEWKNKPILISSAVSFTLVIIALVGIIIYSDSDATQAASGNKSIFPTI